MDTAEHVALLRRAMAQAELSNQDVALALGVSVRTIVNWTSKSNPTMPGERHQEQLRRLLPGYADAGDPVEVAVSHTALPAWRKAALVAEYQKHLHENALESSRLRQA